MRGAPLEKTSHEAAGQVGVSGQAVLGLGAAAARLGAGVWIAAPHGGTTEYAQGRDDWAVHVALWEDGELTAGRRLSPLAILC